MAKPRGEALAEERTLPGEPGYHAHLARYERASSRLRAGISVLDAGSGAGYGAAVLATGNRRVVGVDYSHAAVAFATDRYGAQAEFVEGDVIDLPFPDSLFDAVTCFEVIEHIECPELLVTELAHVLKSDGVLFVSTPHERMERLHIAATDGSHNPYHVHPLDPRSLRRLLRHSFRRVRIYGQSEDLGVVHLVLKSTDIFGLRLRVSRETRETVRKIAASKGPIRQPQFRFSRLIGRSAAALMAEAAK